MLTNVCVYLREINAVSPPPPPPHTHTVVLAFSDMLLHDDGLYQVLKVHTPVSQTC